MNARLKELAAMAGDDPEERIGCAMKLDFEELQKQTKAPR
jgi:hypothetical protein